MSLYTREGGGSGDLVKTHTKRTSTAYYSQDRQSQSYQQEQTVWPASQLAGQKDRAPILNVLFWFVCLVWCLLRGALVTERIVFICFQNACIIYPMLACKDRGRGRDWHRRASRPQPEPGYADDETEITPMLMRTLHRMWSDCCLSVRAFCLACLLIRPPACKLCLFVRRPQRLFKTDGRPVPVSPSAFSCG